MKAKERSYIAYLSFDCRRRHSRQYIGKWVVGFCIQMEMLVADKWVPVIRYDSSHGFAHRDYMRPNGRVEKTSISIKNFGEALTFSENDIKMNWESYKNKFLEDLESHRKRSVCPDKKRRKHDR